MDRAGEMLARHLPFGGECWVSSPRGNGGLGLPQGGYVRIMQDLAAVDGALAVTLGAHQSIGYKALLLYGTEEQKKRYLPKLASGQLIACYCLTEPGSGSDAASVKTRAVLSPDGSHFVLTGNKLWITNGGIASFMTVFAKTSPGGRPKKEKVTAFGRTAALAFRSHRAQPASVRLDQCVYLIRSGCRLKMSWGIGQGFKVAMGVQSRPPGPRRGEFGCRQNALKASIEHCNERV